jgi:hypothetical protein
MGQFLELEQLQMRGVQWSWGAITSVLQCASEVKHLVMKVEFCGDYDTLQPFPEVNLVEFFTATRSFANLRSMVQCLLRCARRTA